MSQEPDMPDTDEATERAPSPARLPWLRVFYWTVRREVWEHRAVFMAPAAASAFAVLAVLLSAGHVGPMLRAAMANSKKADFLMAPYSVVCLAVIVTGLAFAGYYAINALHAERRDRSILFWKSLPVSDLTAVLAKAFVPLILLPPIMFAVMLAGAVLALVISSIAAMLAGIDPRELWSRLHMAFLWAAFGRGMLFLPLWYAPVVGWLMLVSAWARRAPFLWAIAPLIGSAIVEGVMFGKALGLVSAVLAYRVTGWFFEAFSVAGKGQATIGQWRDLDPTRFLTSPQVWAGLAVAVLFLAAAVRLRRRADTL
jgi:ABC-2 type transport system permease protein